MQRTIYSGMWDDLKKNLSRGDALISINDKPIEFFDDIYNTPLTARQGNKLVIKAKTVVSTAGDDCGRFRKELSRIENIRLKDGVSQEEAQILAQQYFVNFVSGCGGAAFPEDRGDRWAFEALQGLAAVSVGEVFIDKKNGTISFEGHPTIQDPVNVLVKKQKEWMRNFGCH